MNKAGAQSPAGQSALLLKALKEPAGQNQESVADDLLLFCYRLRDEYRIIRSTSTRFRVSSFSFLHELLYDLESRPDETLRSEERREFIIALLSDLASESIVVSKK